MMAALYIIICRDLYFNCAHPDGTLDQVFWANAACLQFFVRRQHISGRQHITCLGMICMKSYPSPSEGRQTENHSHRKLTNLITLTTALSNSVKLWAMLSRATQDGWVMVESSDRIWSTGEGNGKLLQYSCLENPRNSMKRQKGKKMNSPGQLVPHILLEIRGEISSEIMERWSQSKNNTQLWMWLVIKARSDAVNSNIA